MIAFRAKPESSLILRRHLTRLLHNIVVLCLLGGCVSTQFNVPRGAADEALYASVYPYYAEFCAVSEIRKFPGSGVDIEGGGPGGHTVLYLNGACRTQADYPEIALCDGSGPDDGVGISVNAHYRNANWTATPGRDFFFNGGVKPGTRLTRAVYDQAQARAKQLHILDGVEFHDREFADQPQSLSRRDFMYELSVATDYAVAFGRDRYCARVPLDRARMGLVVDTLNAANAPYRRREKTFEWSVLQNNCAHLTHNALAAVGLWDAWPTDRPLLIAAFDFPVPKNEFVNLMRRTNDLPIDDLAAIAGDDELRNALLQKSWLPTRPGGLAEAAPALAPNDMYDTKLRLIFFDEAVFGSYQGWFNSIFADPRYTDLRTNLDHFTTLYGRILAQRPAAPGPFARAYYDHIEQERLALEAVRKRAFSER